MGLASGGRRDRFCKLSLGKTHTLQFVGSIFSVKWAARSSVGKVPGQATVGETYMGGFKEVEI